MNLAGLTPNTATTYIWTQKTMRRAFHDTGWMTDNEQFAGIILGYDFCAEHEFGTGGLRDAMEVPPEGGMGLPARKIGKCPDNLRLVEYARKPRDRRRKAYPAAILYCFAHAWAPEDQLLEYAKGSTDFHSEAGDKWHSPREDVVCAWDSSSFAIHVRGPDNIEKLRQLHAAFQCTDIVANSPRVMGFVRNGGLAFGILSAFSEETLSKTLANDEAAHRLQCAIDATGVVKTAHRNGRPVDIGNAFWGAEERIEDLRLYLVPQDQSRFQRAWLSVEEAQAWAKGSNALDDPKGVQAAKDALDARYGTDWESGLWKKLEDAGVKLAVLLRFRLREDGELVFRVWPTKETAHHLPFGEYRVEDWVDTKELGATPS